MTQSIRVNFHCHSDISDGSMPPERVAEALASCGARFAALTDHDSTEGLERFDQALARHGIGFLTGVEITIEGAAEAFHLLAFGFDPENAELQRVLLAHRRRRAAHSVAFSEELRRFGAWIRSRGKYNLLDAMDRTVLGAGEIIRGVHRAGGTVFLAHPLATWPDLEQLDARLAELKEFGLDGIEAIYSEYDAPTRKRLTDLAERHGLLVCAGSDFHGFDLPGLNQISIEFPRHYWNAFRQAHALPGIPPPPARTPEGTASPPTRMHRRRIVNAKRPYFQWKRFIPRIVFPTVLAIGLFLVTIFAVIVPTFENTLMERKRELIRELTNSACSIVAEYEQDARSGLITREEAQRRAVAKIEFLRYGKEQKDYFWITDMRPHMVMHPYQKGLNGSDLTEFADVRGRKLFVEFVKVAREKGEGYVEYYWQWKDNPDRVVPKQSFVKRFEPWEWVIGTGIYLDDVQEEIARLTGRLTRFCLGITGLIAILLAYMTRESLQIERQRSRAEADLRESHEKYAALVEAATEGTLMVLDGHCAYCNKTMADMLGYSEEELSGLGIRDLFPPGESDADSTRNRIAALVEGKPGPMQFEAKLLQKGGALVEVILAFTRIAFAGKTGFIMIAKDLSRHRSLEEELGRSREQYKTLTEKINVGVFRVTADAAPVFLEANPAARQLLDLDEFDDLSAVHLPDLIHDERDREHFLHALQTGGGMQNRLLSFPRRDGQNSFLSISMVAVKNEDGEITCYDGIVEDVTQQKKSEAERDTLIEELQTSLLFLNEPLKNCLRPMQTCDMNTPIARAVQLMSRNAHGAVAVTSGDGGRVIGILTDRDLRERVLLEKRDPETPVVDIMSAPVHALPDTAPVYEAILKMQEKGIHHLGVRDAEGNVVSIVRNADLIQFHQYSSAVITSEIQKAQTLEDIVAARQRLPRLVQTLLSCGARPRNINRITTRLSDAIVERLIDMAVKQLGPPPGRFCFIALGSEGRSEQTLVTDQDNALVYEDFPPGEKERAGEYFLKLGEKVCGWLDQAGYAFCKGNVMARTPRWCQPLAEWKRYFTEWIYASNPQDLLEFNMFFDFRCVSGDREFTRELRGAIQAAMNNHPPFYIHFAQNTLLYKPPIGFFGQIVVESGGQSPNTFNIKEATMPIVNFARLYALRHQVEETNTLDRLHRLYELQQLKKAFYEEVIHAYTFLMQLRLNHQASALADNKTPDNFINPKTLTSMDETMLKQAFSLISAIRKKISYDFLGMA